LEEQKRLVLICEGGAHTVEYFHKNKVFPGAVVFSANKFREIAPYLTKNDDILIVIKGLTDFAMVDIYALLNDIAEMDMRSKLHDVLIMSNIDLGVVSEPYYLYSGDLFYGEVKEVNKGKVYDIVDPNEDVSQKEKKSIFGKKKKVSEVNKKLSEMSVINSVVSRYKVYSKRDIKFTIYGSDKKTVEPMHEIDNIASKIVNVDIFLNKE
jgi:hypothetical protein